MSTPFDLTIDAASRRIVLRAAPLSLGSAWEQTQQLVGRLLSASIVESIHVDRRTASATLRLKSVHESSSTNLRDIAAGLRNPSLPQYLPNDVYGQSVNLRLQKTSTGVTAASIVSQIPGRVRLRHPLLQRNTDVVRRVEIAMRAMADVVSVSASALTGSVLILYRTNSTATPAKLIAVLEAIVTNTDVAVASLANPPISHWVAAGTCLGLATATIVQPALAPLTAAALVCSNLPTLSRGIVELCTSRWKVASLYTVIMGTTLVTGQFLAAALMQTTITCWHAWTNHRLRRLVHDLTALPQWDDSVPTRDSGSALIESARFKAGTVIKVPAGTILPFDGVVVSGEGELDEHCVRGTHSAAHRLAGDAVFAGTVLLKGELSVQVVALDAKTRLASIQSTIHSLICESVGTGGATPRAKQVASKFVPYTFATGTAAFMVGDLTTLAAVLRPDFCTGASLTDRLGTLSSASHLLQEGWLITNGAALEALARINTIVVADASGPAGTPPVLRISLLSENAHPIEVHELKGTLADCVNHIRELRDCSDHIAVVGHQAILSQVADVDLVRISLTPEHCLGQRYVDLIALHAEPQRLPDLMRVLHETRQPGRKAWAAIVGCNALAISGAFLVGLTSLHVIVLTNAGVLAAGLFYERHVRRSKQLLLNHRLRQVPSSLDQDLVGLVDSAPVTPEVPKPMPQPQVLLPRQVRVKDRRLKPTANQPRSPTATNAEALSDKSSAQ